MRFPLPLDGLLLAAFLVIAADPVRAAPAPAGGGTGKLWTVDNHVGAAADFADVQSAVDAASDGDTIRIAASQSYYAAPMIAGKALALLGDSGHANWAGLYGEMVISGLAPGQSVLLSELRMVGSTSRALRVENCAGSVWIVRSGVYGGSGSDGARILASTAVVFDRCTVQGGWGPDGFGPQAPYGGAGGVGVWLEGSRVSVLETTLLGGAGGYDDYHWSSYLPPCDGGAGEAAARLFASSELFLLGSSAQNGDPKWFGPIPPAVLAADASSIVRVTDALVTINTGCETFTQFAGPHEDWGLAYRAIHPPSALLAPPSATVLAQGEPGDAVVLLASAGADSLALPGVYGLLHLSAPLFVVGVKLLPTSGSAVQSFTFPIAAPAQPGQYASLCLQAAFVDALGVALLANPALVKIPL